MVGASFLSMLISEYFFQKRFMRQNDIKIKIKPLSRAQSYILKSAFFRFLALLIPFIFFYAIVQNHYYFTHAEAFKSTREFFDILAILFLIFAFPYIFLTLKYRGDKKYEINDYAILSMIAIKSFWKVLRGRLFASYKPKYKLYKNRRVKKIILLYFVNFFFLTLMARFIVQEFHGFQTEGIKIFSDNFITLSWYERYKAFCLLLFHLIFTVDVTIAIIGYSIASRWLYNRTKSVDATLGGWLAALVCYPPFNAITVQFFGYQGLNTHNLFTDEYILAAILTIVIFLYTLYVWATASLGFKFSNLTNRGIVDKGPYAFVRHPAYTAKNSAWWLDNTFVFTNIWATIALAIWNIIYIMRALTEERHLVKDSAYREYSNRVKYKFIPHIA